MSIDEYFNKSICILEKFICVDDHNHETLKMMANEIVKNFQHIAPHEIHKLAPFRDYSFGGNDEIKKREFSLQQFQNFLNKIDFLPKLNQFYLLAIATLNWNGYIRKKALLELIHINMQLALPFILMRLIDWVPEVRLTALRCVKAALWDCKLSFVMQFSILTDCLFFMHSGSHQATKYFLINYISRQPSNDLLQSLILMDDNKQSHALWPHCTKQILENPMLFDLAQKSKYAFVRNLAFIYIPFSMIAFYAVALKKLPSSHVKLFLARIAQKNDLIELYPLLENILISYLYRNDRNVRARTLVLLTKLKKLNKIDIANIYRSRLQNAKISPGVIRGLGETGSSTDAENIIQFVFFPRAKIRGASIYALFQLHYPEWKTLAVDLLNDKSNRVRREVSYLLKSVI